MRNIYSDQNSSSDDEQLLDAMRTGSLHAFTQLFKRYSRRAVELAMVIVDDRFDAEEIVSDVFYSFWARAAELPEIPSFRAYLFTAVRYRARTVLQQKAGRSKIISLEEYSNEERTEEPMMKDSGSEKLELALSDAIEQLPPQRKLIFKLKRLDGLSYKAIAELLNISENTVRNQLVAALKQLRDQLQSQQTSLISLLVITLLLIL